MNPLTIQSQKARAEKRISITIRPWTESQTKNAGINRYNRLLTLYRWLNIVP